MKTADYLQCTRELLDWYESHYRSLPWRQSRDAYRIWISEIMLQQTRIEAVLPYYERFLNACPDVRCLASLPEDRLMKLWEGLGYYSRARNLQKAAQLIVEKHGGELPADYGDLLALPGIGEYTAGAIASLAYDIPVAAVDGNVMRVLARLFCDDTDVLSSRAKRHFGALVGHLLPDKHAGRFNQALMELGETVCTPGANPRCEICPWQKRCEAYEHGAVSRLPVRAKKKPRRIEKRTVAVVIVMGDPARVLLHKRPPEGLLANLWELPNALDNEELFPRSIMEACGDPIDLHDAKHIFSHVEWHMRGRLYRMPSISMPSEYRAVSLAELRQNYALPSAFRAYSALLPSLLQKEDL